MKTTLYLAAGFFVGWVLSAIFGSCNSTPSQGALPGLPKNSYVISTRTDTVTRDSVIYRDRWHVRTVGTVVYDDSPHIESTPSHDPMGTEFADTSSALSRPYVWRGEAIREGDTVSVAYHHPERYADISLRRHPDTVRTITIVNDSVIGIPDSRKWGIGFHAGIGGQWSGDNIVRAGVQVGVGINFNLWEP